MNYMHHINILYVGCEMGHKKRSAYKSLFYENRMAYVEKEISHRVPLIAGAIQAGINYFDTTFHNEVAVLAAVLKELNARDQVVINSMVLGAFTGSKIDQVY